MGTVLIKNKRKKVVLKRKNDYGGKAISDRLKLLAYPFKIPFDYVCSLRSASCFFRQLRAGVKPLIYLVISSSSLIVR